MALKSRQSGKEGATVIFRKGHARLRTFQPLALNKYNKYNTFSNKTHPQCAQETEWTEVY